MHGLNRLQIVGTVNHDPKLTITADHTARLRFEVGVKERIHTPAKWIDHEECFNVIVWGKVGAALAKVLTKGARVMVEGAVRRAVHEDQNGRHERVELHAHQVLVLADPQRDDVAGLAGDKPQ